MRFTGKLTTWHPDRGFGFITPDEGGQDIFVHISQMPRAIQPKVGQAFGFEVALNPQGKKKAVGVYVHNDGSADKAHADRRRRSQPFEAPASSLLRTLVLLICGATVVTLGYGIYHQRQLPLPGPSSPYQCDGRQHCSQMKSCKEARFFLNYCPGVKMDGDNDGIACEQDLCSGILDQLLR